jgi:hypothetical protein
VQAFEARNPAKAEDAMRLLVCGSREAIRDILRDPARREAA